MRRRKFEGSRSRLGWGNLCEPVRSEPAPIRGMPTLQNEAMQAQQELKENEKTSDGVMEDDDVV